jgi:hypothetical protein
MTIAQSLNIAPTDRLLGSALLSITAVLRTSQDFDGTIAFSKSSAWQATKPWNPTNAIVPTRPIVTSQKFSRSRVLLITVQFDSSAGFSRSSSWTRSVALGVSIGFASTHSFTPIPGTPTFSDSVALRPSVGFPVTVAHQFSVPFTASDGHQVSVPFTKSGAHGSSEQFKATAGAKASNQIKDSDGVDNSKGLNPSGKIPATVAHDASVPFSASDEYQRSKEFTGTSEFEQSTEIKKSLALDGSASLAGTSIHKHSAPFTKTPSFGKSLEMPASHSLKDTEMPSDAPLGKGRMGEAASGVPLIAGIVGAALLLAGVLLFAMFMRRRKEIIEEVEGVREDQEFTEGVDSVTFSSDDHLISEYGFSDGAVSSAGCDDELGSEEGSMNEDRFAGHDASEVGESEASSTQGE